MEEGPTFAHRDLRLDLSATMQNQTRSRGLSFTQALPSVLVPTSLSSPTDPILPGVPPKVGKARSELRKLLAHVLGRLKTRHTAPSVYDSIKSDSGRKEPYKLGAVVESVRSAVRPKLSKEPSDLNEIPGDEDDDVGNDEEYSTDVSYNYMTQLRDVLILSTKQGWKIFETTDNEAVISQRESSSLRRLRRNSRQLGQRSRSPSPNGNSEPPDLLMECIDILASVISEDCRFRMSSSRVFRPPYGLQSVTLDIAQSLVKTHQHDAKILSRIGFAVIPAFSSFNPALHARLLAFFEDGIIRGMLEELQSWQGLEHSPYKDAAQEDPLQTKTPIVAIQVEEAVDDSPATGQRGWLQWSSPSTPTGSSSLSAVAPSQPLVVYYLSSLVPPLLAAVLDAIDLFEKDIKDIPKFHRFHTLLRTIVSMKRDAYLDILEVVAYHGPQTRRGALAILATYWPKALGHVVIGKSLPIMSVTDSLPTQTPSTKLQYPTPLRDHLYAHQFLPWRFFHQDSSSSLDYGIVRNCCQACSAPIIGFGLFCPFCSTGVHLNCYDAPDGTFYGQYLSSSSEHIQYLLSFSNILPPRRDMEPTIVKKARHAFRLANLFTLALCLVCQKPLWGHVMQGMKCSTCMQFVHSSCMSMTSLETFPSCSDFSLSASHVSIDWSILRETFVDHYKEILITAEGLSMKTYEEVSIFYSILWIQHCIFENGIVYKSIVVDHPNPRTPSAKEKRVDDFELQYFLRLYEAYLPSGNLVMSHATQEHYDLNGMAASNEHSLLFDWPLLANISSVIKTPLPANTHAVPPTSNLLQVKNPNMDDIPDLPAHPYELTFLSQMRNTLGLEFQVYSDCAARYMLSHIHQVGFFDRTDLHCGLFDDPIPSEVLCSFPLPSGLDLSTSVETLVVAIEACLGDIDVAVNEYGFLLLVRRFWPTGAASEYALTRLTNSVLSWTLAEDDRLVIIARNHIASNLSLPGVRSISDASPWPSTTHNHSKQGLRGGGEYVLCRKQLLMRHALPWLSAVHLLDPLLYITFLYEYCMEVANASDSRRILGSFYMSKADPKVDVDAKIAWGETMLKSIIKLMQSNVILSGFEAILTRWFDSVSSPGVTVDSIIFKSLPRLFNHEGDPSRRSSTANDNSLSVPDSIHIDPWNIFNAVASEGLEGLTRCLSWLRVMSHSAVDIPLETLKRIFDLARDLRASFQIVVPLLESTMIYTWLKTFGSNGLDLVMTEVNDIWADDLLCQMQSSEDIETVLDFLRYSLVTSLLVYGCDRQTIISLGLIRREEIHHLPQRRRMARVSTVPAALEINPKLVATLSRYVEKGPDSVCMLVARFLNTLVSESALLEPHEIDQFILVNGDALSRCAWRFYDLSSQDLNEIRTSFLLRILVVDPQPFHALLRGVLQSEGKLQARFQTVTRLFRVVLDVTSPSFGVEGRQWKSNVTDVLNHFFRALWADEHEEIRLAVDTWSRTLLPPHLRVISACWDEHMSKSPISDRAKLSAFLVQLHPHFPAWHLLSWETIIEVLLDDDFVQSNGEGEDGYAAAAHLSVYGYPPSSERQQRIPNGEDPDIVALRVSLLLLSLQMIADGVSIDIVHLLKIKLILAKVIGFSSATLHPIASGQGFYVQFETLTEIRQLSFSCISPLMRVLDASHPLSLPPSSMGVTWNEIPVLGLVGDVFIDVVAGMWENITNVQILPYSVLRALLETMLLVIVKHDLNSPALKHFEEAICRAVKTVTDLVVSDSSYDIRHLCLSVMQAFMQDYPVLALRILGHQVTVLTRLTASLHFSADDTLVLQTREFLGTAFVRYEVSGLFWLLSKNGRMSDDFFVMLRNVVNNASSETDVLGETLRDSIVRDTLSKVAANVHDRSIPDVLYNLEKYVSQCHHQSYPVSLIQHVGLRLTAIARQTADSASSTMNRSVQAFDPNPLLLISATIVQHNKAQSVDLLLHTETLLRAALVRFEVRPETLNRLLHVVSTMYRRSKTVNINGTEFPTNHIVMGVLEVLWESLKGKMRVQPSTMAAIVEAVITLHNEPSTSYVPTSTVLRAGADAITYLTYTVYRDTYGQAEFAASLAAAKLLLYTSSHDSAFLGQCLIGDVRSPPPVRVWNLVSLAALQGPDPDGSIKLLGLLPSFVLTYTSSLKIPLSGTLNESAAPSVNHAFASVKLWMLMARKSCKGGSGDDVGDSDAAERMVWNALWPSFERLLVLSLADGPNGETPPLLTFMWSCISDLMLFVRQARSVVALDTSSHVSILNKLRTSSRGESVGGKFARALRSISEPPAGLSFDALLTQVASDVLTAEKLQAVEVHRENGADKRREYSDRRRVEARDLRATS